MSSVSTLIRPPRSVSGAAGENRPEKCRVSCAQPAREDSQPNRSPLIHRPQTKRSRRQCDRGNGESRRRGQKAGAVRAIVTGGRDNSNEPRLFGLIKVRRCRPIRSETRNATAQRETRKSRVFSRQSAQYARQADENRRSAVTNRIYSHNSLVWGKSWIGSCGRRQQPPAIQVAADDCKQPAAPRRRASESQARPAQARRRRSNGRSACPPNCQRRKELSSDCRR